MDKELRKIKILGLIFIFGLLCLLAARVIELGMSLGWW